MLENPPIPSVTPTPPPSRNKLSNLQRLAVLAADRPFYVPETHVLEGGHFRISLNSVIPELADRLLPDAITTGDMDRIRQALLLRSLPSSTQTALDEIYAALIGEGTAPGLCVRSCFELEDRSSSSFAGVFETVPNVTSRAMLERAVQVVYASAFSPRALAEIRTAGLEDFPTMSVAIQPMMGGAGWLGGVAHTQCPDLVPFPLMSFSVSSSAADVTSGSSIPEDYLVNRDNLSDPARRVIVQAQPGTDTVNQFSLSDATLRRIASVMIELEETFEAPLEIEWLLDPSGRLHLLQARPAEFKRSTNVLPSTDGLAPPICVGTPVGSGRITAKVRKVESLAEALHVPPGNIIVAHNTDPDWVPVIRSAAALVTAIGARTSHVSRTARESSVLAVVGVGESIDALSSGLEVTLVCAEGIHGAVYEGRLSDETSPISTKAVHVGNAAMAFSIGRNCQPDHVHFDLSSVLRSFRLPLVDVDQLTDRQRRRIAGYPSIEAFAKQKLIEAVCLCSTAFPSSRLHLSMSRESRWESLLASVAQSCQALYGVSCDVTPGSVTN